MKCVKCPKCKKEIDYLENIQTGTARWVFFINKKGERDYSKTPQFEGDDGDNYWACPECNEDLFRDEDEAAKFLGEREYENI